MDSMLPAILGTLLIVGVVGSLNALLRWWVYRRRSRQDVDRIVLAFPLESPRMPGDTDEVESEHHLKIGGTRNLRRSADPVGHASGNGRARPADHGWVGGADAELEADPRTASRAFGRLDLPPGRQLPPSRHRPLLAAETSHSSEPPPPATEVGDRGATERMPSALPNEEELEAASGRALRFHQGDDRTMRLLPGRLEVEEGDDSRTEIRFVERPAGRPEVTFGRSAGEPLRHVQLHSPTVSRTHARMHRAGKEWVITNLSRTNPIVVNGIRLEGVQREQTLRDGDRIEMGEVVFRYREQ